MYTSTSKATGSTRSTMMAVAAIVMASFTAIAANAATPELNRSHVYVTATAFDGDAAAISATTKTADHAKVETAIPAPAKASSANHSALDASVLAPYTRLLNGKVAESAFA
jgi:hypothetical protein